MHKASLLEVSMIDSACLHIPTERVGITIVSDFASSAYETLLYLFADHVAVKDAFCVQMIRD